MSTLDLTVQSSDIIQLIEAHLTECGLHEACRALREESGVKSAGVLNPAQWKAWAHRGEWGEVLSNLATLDNKIVPSELLSDVYEITILELAEVGDIPLAYALMRSVVGPLDSTDESSERNNDKSSNSCNSLPKSRLLDQRLAALMAMKGSNKSGLPRDFYGDSGTSKQQRRDDIGRQLMEVIPQIPAMRLTSIIQQAIKWQSYTGQLPVIKEYWPDEDGNKSSKKQKRFHLVLGDSDVSAGTRTGTIVQDDFAESIPTKNFSSVSFGKKATAEAALFLPDGSSLVTGSSDGLVEIWSATSRYKDLRMDLPYQQKEELIGHDDTLITAMAVSNDGAMLATGDAKGLVKVWKIDDAKCLREIPAHPNSTVTCLDFSPDASHILTASHDGTVREYGLRTRKMLKEFQGHSSFVNSCKYVMLDDSVLRIVTGSADGTARIWDGRSSEVILILRPFSKGPDLTEQGMSIIQKSDAPNVEGCPNLHTTIPLHTPPESVLLVPRGRRAFLVSMTGIVLRTFDADPKSVFVTATVSPSNRWLYAVTDTGFLHVFDMTTGTEETVMKHFVEETCHLAQQNGALPEMTSILHHPLKGVVAAFSNDKSQRKGVLGLWK